MYTPGAGQHRSPAAAAAAAAAAARVAAGGPPSGAASASSSTSSAPTPNSFAAHPFWLGPQPPSHGSHAPFPQPHPPTYYMPHQQPPLSYGYQHQAQAVMTSPAAMYPTMACPPAPWMTSQENSLPWKHEQDDAIDKGSIGKWEQGVDVCSVCMVRKKRMALLKPCMHLPFCDQCLASEGRKTPGQVNCPHCGVRIVDVLSVVYMQPTQAHQERYRKKKRK